MSFLHTRILLADDSALIRAALKRLLVELNPTWEIHEAESGRQALEKMSLCET